MKSKRIKGSYRCKKCRRILQYDDVTLVEYCAMVKKKLDCTVCDGENSVEFGIDGRIRPVEWAKIARIVNSK